jgi:hypothetical protein
MKPKPDYELEVLLNLDRHEFNFARNYIVKYQVRRVVATKGRPSGIKYSLTLHDPKRKRIYGIDNAHRARRRHEFDHRHPYGSAKLVAYEYRGPVVLLEDFLREVERILTELVSYEETRAGARNLQNRQLWAIQGVHACRRARPAQNRPDRAKNLGRIGGSFRQKGSSCSIPIAGSRRQASIAEEPRLIASDRGPATKIGKRACHLDPPR